MSTMFGVDIGSVLSWTLCGFLIESFGWPYAFYVPALILAAFTILWWQLVYDTPAQHPRISADERRHIEQELSDVTVGLKVIMRALLKVSPKDN